MLTQFDYQVKGVGWAYLDMATEETQVSIRISYICEPLPLLLKAVARLLLGETPFAIINFRGENMDHDLALTEIEPGILRIEVFGDAYFTTMEPEERTPMPILTAYDRTYSFAWDILQKFETLIRKMTPEKYEESWCSPFPTGELKQLKDAISVFNSRGRHLAG